MPRRATRNVSLTPQLDRFVESEVRSGRYGSASEVVRDSLRVLREQNKREAAALKELRQKISRGLRDGREGRVIDGETFFRDLEARLVNAPKTQRRKAS
jgi:antitoxin ParD1/3/4